MMEKEHNEKDIEADVRVDDRAVPPTCGQGNATSHRLQELTALLEDVTKLEKTMMAAKQVHEKLYVTLKKDLHRKIKSVQYLEKEMSWLKGECMSTENVCNAVSVQKDCREGQLKKFLSDALDLDVDEAADRLPRIYRQYRGLKTAEDGNQLIAEIEATKNQLNKLHHLTNMKQQSISRENNSLGSDRMPRTDSLLKSILERMATSTENQRRESNDNSVTSIQADSIPQAADSRSQPIRSLLHTMMSANQSPTSEATGPVTVDITSTTSAASHADSSGLLAPMSDQWLHTYREVLASTLPASNLLSEVITAEEYVTEGPQLCEVDMLPDEFGTIL